MRLDKNFIIKKTQKIEKKIDAFEKIEQKIGKLGLDLVKKMLELNPLKRITASEAKKHDYFKILKDLTSEN